VHASSEKTYDDALRIKLLDRAGELLSAAGPKALSLRKLAADAETSTTAVYSLFGGKTELVNGLRVEGFQRFRTKMAAVTRTGDAMRTWCGSASPTGRPHWPTPSYSIMFHRGGARRRAERRDRPSVPRGADPAVEEAIRAGVEWAHSPTSPPN
jgi:AcrR family transcriptional regulator